MDWSGGPLNRLQGVIRNRSILLTFIATHDHSPVFYTCAGLIKSSIHTLFFTIHMLSPCMAPSSSHLMLTCMGTLFTCQVSYYSHASRLAPESWWVWYCNGDGVKWPHSWKLSLFPPVLQPEVQVEADIKKVAHHDQPQYFNNTHRTSSFTIGTGHRVREVSLTFNTVPLLSWSPWTDLWNSYPSCILSFYVMFFFC